MKKYCIIVFAVCSLAGITSCKHVKEPESADFSWYYYSDYSENMIDLSKVDKDKKNPSKIELSDQICFIANGADANSYVVWPGEPGHMYEERDLSDELKKDTVNNVAKKATGIALSTRDGKGRYMKSYKYSVISPSGNPFHLYCTARNYDYESGEYKEIKAGPYSLEVVDTKTDLWNVDDPYNLSKKSTDYAIGFMVDGKVLKKYGEENSKYGTYEISDDIVGIIAHYKKGLDASKCEIILKINKCIPFSDNGTFKYNVKNQQYSWTVDLTSPVVLTLGSQSSVAEGYLSSYANKAVGDEGVDSKGYTEYPNDKTKIVKPEYTKDYTFKAVENAE